MMASLVLLFIGLLVSRALLSFASVLIAVPFFFQYRQSNAQKGFYWGIGLILFPVIISFFWSDDVNLWWNSLSTKLVLITMLLGLSCVTLSAKQWMQVTQVYLFIMAMGCLWSLWQYAGNFTAIQESYLKAKLLPTPADDDHLRFSWMVVTGIFLGIKCLQQERQRMMRAALIFLVIFFIVYLHILAAKTGLVCFYLGAVIYFLYVIIIQKKWKKGLGLAAVLVASAMLCYFTMPTLRNRIQYVLFDFDQYSGNSAVPGYNDAARWQSIRAGYAITNQHPLSGVGFGDMLSAVDQWHREHHPASFSYERFLPANEWLVYGVGSGWPGMACFAAGFLLLLYKSTSRNVLSVVLSAASAIPFLVDDTLEGQYGVTVLAFIVFFGQQKLAATPVNT